METNKKGGANRSEVLSMACFAFMTHTNSPEIALRFTGGPSSARWVLAVQTLVLWAVYCGIAVCGYMSFLEDTKQLGFFGCLDDFGAFGDVFPELDDGKICGSNDI